MNNLISQILYFAFSIKINSCLRGILIIYFIFFTAHNIFSQSEVTSDSLTTVVKNNFVNVFSEIHAKEMNTQSEISSSQNIYELKILLSKINLPELKSSLPGLSPFAVDLGYNVHSDSLNKLSTFRLNLDHLLQVEYRKSTKYSLGSLSQYLGISKKIVAIVLGIISLL